ncbi:MAG: ribosomal L7Ae/L30e/S12e/Gadd45 family protein [Limnochordia bacterium]|jgi:large subunit ribosomal protein L7A
MPNRLKKARMRVVGAKQTQRALQSGTVAVVYMAEDADKRLLSPIVDTAREEQVEIVFIPSMAELGQLCRIAVGAACAAILQEEPQ